MLRYEVETEIDASPEVVWSLLTDGAGYAAWDQGIRGIEGTIADGERIAFVAEVSPKRPFKVTVAFPEPGRIMTWTGGMPLGLFRGVRTFTVSARGDGTHVAMREVFTGPMVGLISRSMPDLDPSFRQFAAGLKAKAEAAVVA